jgi:hypothetical protein
LRHASSPYFLRLPCSSHYIRVSDSGHQQGNLLSVLVTPMEGEQEQNGYISQKITILRPLEEKYG